MIRHSLVVSVVVALVTSALVTAEPVHRAEAAGAITNVLATDVDGVPTDFLYADQELWAYVTSVSGGLVCAHPLSDPEAPIGSLGCRDEGTWGFGVAPPLSALWIPIKGAPLALGQWVLVAVDALDHETARSQEFTVDACVGCAALNPYKSDAFIHTAGAAVTALKAMCGLFRAFTIGQAAQRGYLAYQTALAAGPGGAIGFSGAALTGVTVAVGGTIKPEVNLLSKAVLGLCTAINVAAFAPSHVGGLEVVLEHWLDDPPDPNYDVVPAPQFVDLSGYNLPSDETGIADSGLRAQVWAAAALDSFERYQGAELAGSSHWMSQQADAMSEQLFGWSHETRRTADALRSMASIVDVDPDYDAPVLDQAAITGAQAFTDRVRSSGLTSEEIDHLHGLGFDDAGIEQLVTGWSVDLHGVDPSVDPVVLMRDVATQLDSFSRSLDDYAVLAGSAASSRQVNEPPTASFTATPQSGQAPLFVQFDGSGSSDPDGTIVGHAWSFGDGASGSGVSPGHTYTNAGQYTTTLTVTDDRAGTASISKTITVTVTGGGGGPDPGNQPPVARIDTDVQPFATGTSHPVYGTSSTDTDGRIVAYRWDFGNGTTSDQPFAYPSYDRPGTYTVRLTVTDDRGATGTATVTLTVWAAPVASITTSPGNSGTVPFAVTFDASGSSDADGSIVSYDWLFPDGSTDAGPRITRTFAVEGVFRVRLRVTDNDGRTTDQFVSISAETPADNAHPIASFTSAVTSGHYPPVLTLDARLSSDPDGTIVQYLWDFGDGTTGTGATTTHTYRSTSNGRYPVQLTVVDNRGATATLRTDVDVEAGSIRFIESAGPLTKIGTDVNLGCYADYAGDRASQFYAGWACGTFLAVGGGASSVTYGSDPPAGFGARDQPFVAERLDAPTGAGTSADPYVTRAEVLAGDTGLRVLQRDSYVVGSQSYRTDVTVVNESTTPQEVVLYRAADCYLQNSDSGFGGFDGATGAVSCVAPSGRIEQWYPLTPGSHHVEGDYGGVWHLVGRGVDFPDTVLPADLVDNGAGLSWRLQLAPGERASVSHLTVFSPLGIAPVSASATAAPSTVGSGGTVAYTVTVHNPNGDAVTLDALSVTLPPGFTIVPGSTTGLTSADPVGATWAGPLVVGAGTSTLSFSAVAGGNAGTFTIDVAGSSAATTVVGAVSVAPVTVTGGGGNTSLDATDDAGTVDTGSKSVFYVLDNDIDGGAGRPTIVASTPPASGGTLDCSSGFWCTYTAPVAPVVDTFTYTVRDSAGETDTATVTVTVQNPGTDPSRFRCLNYPDFSSTVGLNIGGDSRVVNNALRLTPALTGQTGRVWTTDKVNISHGFSTDFVFRFTEQGGIGAADGITFAIQNSSAGAVGSAGGSLAYQGIDHSLVVEFDTFDNGLSFGDPDNNHIAVHSAGAGPNGPGGPGTTQLAVQSLGSALRMADGGFHHARVTYDPAGTGTLKVFVDNMVTSKLSVSVDIDDLLDLIGSKSWIGFTSATGAGVENHDVLNWRLCSAGVDAIEPNSAPTASFTAIPASGLAPLDVTLDATASNDSDGAIISYDWDFGDGASGTGVTAHHAFDPGVYSVTLVVTDDRGATATAVEQVTASRVNHVPTADAKSLSTSEDTPVGLTLSGSDPDGDALTFAVVSGPSHGSLLGTGASLTYTPDPDYNGPDSFTYTARDGLLTSPPATVSIPVTPVNDPPALAAIAGQTIPEMVGFSLALVGSDVDGDQPLTYSLSSGPDGIAVAANNGTLTWTPTESQGPGSYPVTVMVHDPAGLSATRSFTLTVVEVNRSPLLAPIGDRTVLSGDAVGLGASASDPDLPANTLTYGLVAAPAGATLDQVTGAFSWNANAAAGDYPVTISISDGHGGGAQTSFTIHVVRRATALVLGGDSNAQYSDRATITARLSTGVVPLAAQQVTIGLGAQSSTVTTDASGLASATFSVISAAGVLPTSASFAGTAALAPTTASGTFAVGREDASVLYTGDTIGLVRATLTLAATFTDSAAPGYAGSNPEPGGTIGDITKARIAFDVFNAATCMSGSPIATVFAPVVDTGAAGDGIGSAKASWSTATEGSFCVVATLVATTGTASNTHYTAPPAMAAGLAVFADTVGKVTGGGCITDSKGRHNFGFNATSTGTKTGGNLVFIERRTYAGVPAMLIVKSNAIDTLRTSGSTYPVTATLTGKASLKFISTGNGSTLFESGAATFTATVVDTGGSSRVPDSFGVRVVDKTGVTLVDIPLTAMSCGNIVAHLK